MLFASTKRLNNVSKMNVKCDNVEISSKSEVNYLGTILNPDMSAQSVGNNAMKKINSNLFFFSNDDFFDMKCRKLICSSIIQFDYGCNMWYRSIVNSLTVTLQTAPNTIIKFTLKQEPRYHWL